MLIYTPFLWHHISSSSLNTDRPLNFWYIKWTPYVVFVGSFLDLVFDYYIQGGGGVFKETAAKTAESVHCYHFLLGMFGTSFVGHRQELPVLHYHEIMVIYLYPFLVVITKFSLDYIYEWLYMHINWFTWIIFFHDRICYTKKSGGTRILQLSQRNGKLLLPWKKQGNHPVIPIYGLG